MSSCGDTWDHCPTGASIHEDDIKNYLTQKKKKKKWDWWRPLNDVAKTEYKKAVMTKKSQDEKANLETLQKVLRRLRRKKRTPQS